MSKLTGHLQFPTSTLLASIRGRAAGSFAVENFKILHGDEVEKLMRCGASRMGSEPYFPTHSLQAFLNKKQGISAFYANLVQRAVPPDIN